MTTLQQADLQIAMLHLRHSFRAMRRFMEMSADWTAKVQIDEQFKHLRDDMREFARCQYGIEDHRRCQRDEKGR